MIMSKFWQYSACSMCSSHQEVVESAAATFKEEGLVVLKGASAGLSLDEAEHAIEKIEVTFPSCSRVRLHV